MPSSQRPKKAARTDKARTAGASGKGNHQSKAPNSAGQRPLKEKKIATGRALRASDGTLRAFDGLSSEAIQARASAGDALLRSIGTSAGDRVSLEGEKVVQVDSLKEESKYVLIRLIRGLGSGHDASRQGYAAALVETLLAHRIGLNDAYLLLRDHLATQGDGHKVRTGSGALDQGRLSSTEDKHRMLGRCFGYFALVRAGLLAGSGGLAGSSATAVRQITAASGSGSGSVISLATGAAASSSTSAGTGDAAFAHAGKIAAAIVKDATYMAGQRDFMRPICGEVLAVLLTAVPWRMVQRFLLGPLSKLLGGKAIGWDGGLLAAVLALEEAWEASAKGREAKASGHSVPSAVSKLREALASDKGAGSKEAGSSIVTACARAAEESFPRVHPAWRRILWRFARRGVLLPARAGLVAANGLQAPSASDLASFRAFWRECVEERMMRVGNARERAAALIVVSATLPLCPPGSAVAPMVWSHASAGLVVSSTAGGGRFKRGGKAAQSQKDSGRLALEAVVRSATERAESAKAAPSSSSPSSSSSSSSSAPEDFASSCMVTLAGGMGRGQQPAGTVKRAVAALQQLLTGKAVESYGATVLQRLASREASSEERTDAMKSVSELVLNLTGGKGGASAGTTDADTVDGAVWLGQRKVSPSTLEFIYSALRSMTRSAVFVQEGAALDKSAAAGCREQLAQLVAELAHRGSAPAETASSGDGEGESASSEGAEAASGKEEPKLQDKIDASARAALSWAGTCHAAVEDGLESLAGVASATNGALSGGGAFEPAGLVPIPGGSAALRARQIALAVSAAFADAAAVLDVHGDAAVQQGRRLLLNGAASLSLSALACIVEVKDASRAEGDEDEDEDEDEEPDASDLELCAATEDLAVGLCRLLWPFVRAAADVEGGDGSAGSEKSSIGKKSKKGKKSSSSSNQPSQGVRGKIEIATAAMKAAGLGSPGEDADADESGDDAAAAVDIPSGESSTWLDGARTKAGRGSTRDAFAVVADVVLALLSRAESLTQEAANAALRACSQFLSVEGLKTLLGPAESLAAGRALPTDEEEEEDEDDMDGSSGSDSSDSEDEEEEEEDKEISTKSKPIKQPAMASSGAGGDGEDSDSDSDDDLDQMKAVGEAAEKAAAFIIRAQRDAKKAVAQAKRARQSFVLRTLAAVEVLLRRVDGSPMCIYFGWPLLHLLLLSMRRAVVAAGDAAASGGKGEAREAQQAAMALATRLGSLLRRACRSNGGSIVGWRAAMGDGKAGPAVLGHLVADAVSCFELSKKSPGTDFLAAACDTAFLFVKAAKTVAGVTDASGQAGTWGLGKAAADRLLLAVSEQAQHYLSKAGSKLSLLPVQTLLARATDGSRRAGAASGAGEDEATIAAQDLQFAWRLAPLLSFGCVRGRNDFRREECFKLSHKLCKATADAKAWDGMKDLEVEAVAVDSSAAGGGASSMGMLGSEKSGSDDSSESTVTLAKLRLSAIAGGLTGSLATTTIASTAKLLRAGKKAAKGVDAEDKERVLAAAGSDFDDSAVKPSRLVAAMSALRTMLRAAQGSASDGESTAAAAGLPESEGKSLQAAARAIYDGKLGGGALRNAARGCMTLLGGDSDTGAKIGGKRPRKD